MPAALDLSGKPGAYQFWVADGLAWTAPELIRIGVSGDPEKLKRDAIETAANEFALEAGNHAVKELSEWADVFPAPVRALAKVGGAVFTYRRALKAAGLLRCLAAELGSSEIEDSALGVWFEAEVKRLGVADEVEAAIRHAMDTIDECSIPAMASLVAKQKTDRRVPIQVVRRLLRVLAECDADQLHALRCATRPARALLELDEGRALQLSADAESRGLPEKTRVVGLGRVDRDANMHDFPYIGGVARIDKANSRVLWTQEFRSLVDEAQVLEVVESLRIATVNRGSDLPEWRFFGSMMEQEVFHRRGHDDEGPVAILFGWRPRHDNAWRNLAHAMETVALRWE